MKVSYDNEQSVQNKWVIAHIFLKSIFSGSYHLFLPAYSFKTLPEALKLSYYPVCGKINRLTAGNQPEINWLLHAFISLS